MFPTKLESLLVNKGRNIRRGFVLRITIFQVDLARAKYLIQYQRAGEPKHKLRLNYKGKGKMYANLLQKIRVTGLSAG